MENPNQPRKKRIGFTIEDGVQLRRRVSTRKARRGNNKKVIAKTNENDVNNDNNNKKNNNNSSNGNNNNNNNNINHTTTTDHTVRDGVVAGSIAGSLADIIMHPFDTVNTRQKVKRGPSMLYRSMTFTAAHILRTEGIKGWFNGVSAAALSALPSNAIYFGSYEFIKSQSFKYFGTENAKITSTTYLAAGAMSELAASIVYTPFEVVKTRMQLGNSWLNAGEVSPRVYTGTFNAFKTILNNEGFLGLYSGYRACILTDCTYSALQFLVYEKLKQQIEERYYTKHDGIKIDFNDTQILIIGGLAGGIASVITNPLDVFTARIMTQQKLSMEHGGGYYYNGIIDCCTKMYHEEGLLSLYQGWQPRMIRFMFLAGITFTIYERVKWILGWQDGENDDIDGF